MEGVNADIMQSGLQRLWAKRQGTILGHVHEIRDEILDQGQCASSFDNQPTDGELLGDRVKSRDEARYLEKELADTSGPEKISVSSTFSSLTTANLKNSDWSIEETSVVNLDGAELNDFPAKYSVPLLRPYEFAAVGVWIHPNIVPGFKYKVRPIENKERTRFLFDNRALELMSIGRGYSRRLTFEASPGLLNDNENYFWTDSMPSGYAFQVHVVSVGDNFTVFVNSHVITRNPRITVSHDKHRTWFLHINNVQQEDRGRYMCQINTITAKTQIGYLNVVVPPSISDSLSSSDAIVREGANVSLTCHVDGYPKPDIKWKRDDGLQININKTLNVSEWEEPTLELHRISRLDMGAYLCIATNSVPPSVSKRIKVSVDFPPMLWIPHQLVGVPLGYNVTLECYTEAHPTSLHYWTRDSGQMLHDSSKYKAMSIQGVPSYKVQMKLTIVDVSHTDYGVYKCVAKNSRGETDGTIRLYSPQWTTDGSNDLENGTSNNTNGKGRKKDDDSILNEITRSGQTYNKPNRPGIIKNSTPRLIPTITVLVLTAAVRLLSKRQERLI